MAASSSQSHKIPRLLLDKNFQNNFELFERYTSRNSPLSPSRKNMVQSESFETVKISPLVFHTLKTISAPAISLSKSLDQENRTVRYETERRLRRFFRATAEKSPVSEGGGLKRLSDSHLLILSPKKKWPMWVRIEPGQRITKDLRSKMEEAMHKLVGLIDIILQQNRDTFTTKPIEEGVVVRVQQSPKILIDRFLQNNNFRRMVNRKASLRAEVMRCYIVSVANKLYLDCGTLYQALFELEKNVSLFNGLSRLRQIANQRVLDSPALENPTDLITFYGYSKIFASEPPITYRHYSAILEENSFTALTFDGCHVLPANECLIRCRDMAKRIVDEIGHEVKKNHKRIRRNEDLYERLCKNIELRNVGNMTAAFEQGFYGFIDSSFILLQERFDVNMEIYRAKLDRSIQKPYDWVPIRDLLSKLNFVVCDLLNRYDSNKSVSTPISFLNTPRDFEPL